MIPKKLESLAEEIAEALQEEIRRIGYEQKYENDNPNNISDISDNSSSSGNDEPSWNDFSEFLPNKPKKTREICSGGGSANNIMDNSATSAAEAAASTIKLEVIFAWKDLLTALVEQHVFLDYVQSLEDAFREIAEKPALNIKHKQDTLGEHFQKILNESEVQHMQAAQMLWFRHQLNLTHLLTHTVANHFRDNCTECRFVTLLEIALSYQSSVTSDEGDSTVVYQWKPSNDVQRFWVRLMQPIDPDMPPFEFRRKAYGVLVSLSWVPSSKGLLRACSIADNRPAPSAGTPLEARRVLSKIPRRPLARSDSVYQVLDRLKDETNVSVVISASKYNKITSLGVGKTTVAALVASHPLILRIFKVMWLNMDYKKRQHAATTATIHHHEKDANLVVENSKPKLEYAQYIEYLDSLCDQLGCPQIHRGANAKVYKESTEAETAAASTTKTPSYTRPVWPEAHSLKRLEEPAIRHRREENLMRRAKQMMADLLDTTGSNILLILDDVTEEEELKWFHFTEKQSTLATGQDIMHAAEFNVELDPWGEAESVELFLLEAGCPESHAMASATELKRIVSVSKYHPIIVRSAARWFMLKKVTVGLIEAMEEAEQEFTSSISRAPSAHDLHGEALLAFTSAVPRALSTILNNMLSPTTNKTQKPSILFKLCLASMAAVFADSQPVPLTAVLLLWEQLFIMEPDALEECGGKLSDTELRKRVWFIAEGLSHMGVLSFTEDECGEALVAIHHELYVTYALGLVAEMELGVRPEDVIVQWHKAFVAAYLSD